MQFFVWCFGIDDFQLSNLDIKLLTPQRWDISECCQSEGMLAESDNGCSQMSIISGRMELRIREKTGKFRGFLQINGFLQMMKPWPVEGLVLARALWLRMMLLEVAAVEACSRRMEKVRLGSFRQEENTFKRHNSGRTMIVYARCTRHTYTYIYICIRV